MQKSSKTENLAQNQTDLREKLYSIFGEMDDSELAATLSELEQLESDLKNAGPQNPDELWLWVRDNIGVELTRYSVCEDHDAPFDVLCDMFFEEKFEWPHPQHGTRVYGGVGSVLIMASRGGSKTFIASLLHFLCATFKPGYEGATFGAQLEQGKRAYAHIVPWVTAVRENANTGKKERKERDGISYTQRSETVWEPVEDKAGVPRSSKIEILGSTPESVNGPHPNVAHADEIEQMRADTYAESRNMPVAGVDAYGKKIMPRNILTSTRKSKYGKMQELIDTIHKAKAEGDIPPMELKIWCIFEVSAQVENCRQAPENADEPDEVLCNCNRIPSGTWDDGSTRRLEQVCSGKFYRSRGWQPKEQIDEFFRQNPRSVWEAQQECREPEVENNYIQGWRIYRSVVHNYDPDPSLGPILQGIDFGGINAVIYFQYLYYDTEVIGFNWKPKLVPAGSLIVFDEIYKADIGAGKLGTLIIERETAWRSIYPDFKINARFGDPANKQARIDLMDAGIQTTWWNATRDFQIGLDIFIDRHEGRWDDMYNENGFIYVTDSNEVQEMLGEPSACLNWRQEVEFWRRNDKGIELDEMNHAMACTRMVMVNVEKGIGRRISSPSSARKRQELKSRQKRLASNSNMKSGPLRFGGKQVSEVVKEFGNLR